MNQNPYDFHKDTPDKVRDILTRLNLTRERVRIFFGNTETGRAWMEEHDVTGVIGKSTGSQPIPLLVHNARSMGGPALLDHCIVRIITTHGRELYRHPQYSNPADEAIVTPSDLPEYAEAVTIGGEVHARFKKPGQAARWLEFMQGKRFSK